MLAGIEGKDLGPTFFMGIDLGVLEGQISWGLFSDSIVDPSVIGAKPHLALPPGACKLDITQVLRHHGDHATVPSHFNYTHEG